MSTSSGTHDTTRCLGEQGGAIVELALAIPLLVVLVLGLAEYGTIWQQQSVLTRSAQSAARTGATQGTQRFADYNTIKAMDAGLAAVKRVKVERVVVYRADNANGGVPAVCRTMAVANDLSAKGNAASHCNVYSAAQIAYTGDALSVFSGNQTTGCTGASWDQYWCPTTRSRGTDVSDPDYLGVYVNTEYTPLTGLIGSPQIEIDADVVFRLDPCITSVTCED